MQRYVTKTVVIISLILLPIAAQPLTAWIERAQYQQNSSLADSLIRNLPDSPARDTFLIRSALFANKSSEAIRLTSALQNSPFWAGNPGWITFWTMRVHLLSGSPQVAFTLLDSCDIESRLPCAPEWYERALAATEMMGDEKLQLRYATLSRLIYTHRDSLLMREAATLSDKELTHASLISPVIAYLNDCSRYGESIGLAKRAKILHAARFDYLTAEALLQTGDTTAAQKLLLELLLDTGSPVFSQKAAILLKTLDR